MQNWRDRTLNEIAAIEQEAEGLQERLKVLRERRTKLKKKLYDGRTDELRGSDSLLVLISDIRPAIQQWIELYDRQHGKGGQLLLAEKAVVSTRRIRSIVNGGQFAGRDTHFVTLQTADRLFSAMGMGYKVKDLDWYPNGTTRAPIPEPPQSQYYEE